MLCAYCFANEFMSMWYSMYMLMYIHTYTAISVIIQENQSVVINPEVHKSNGQIVPVTTKSNSVKDSLGTVTSREVIMYICVRMYDTLVVCKEIKMYFACIDFQCS